jgi:hypothetical protein
VQSRIHLAIRYNDLTEEQKRNIFNIFLDEVLPKGERGREDISRWLDMGAIKYELNGRQIRNIVSSAQLLAHSKRETLNYGHLQRVTDMTKNFQKQLERLTIGRRAQNEGAGA